MVVARESIGPEAAGSRALFQVITPRSSKAPDRRSVVYPGKQGPRHWVSELCQIF